MWNRDVNSATNIYRNAKNAINIPDIRYNKPINYDEEYNKFYDKIKKYKMNDIIAIDETGISIGLHIKNWYEYIGKRLDKITTDNKVFVKYTLIMAI